MPYIPAIELHRIVVSLDCVPDACNLVVTRLTFRPHTVLYAKLIFGRSPPSEATAA